MLLLLFDGEKKGRPGEAAASDLGLIPRVTRTPLIQIQAMETRRTSVSIQLFYIVAEAQSISDSRAVLGTLTRIL